ncbi:uncharacterized protein M6B38_364325 [Iris pallida]|uniref:Phosphatidylinositol-specific phospholipase C X domain-containing protein n=1 Tax=Iris pallida TaxID=29817 RepID=A0AAX6GIA7_IRIPA|nr:uncharacterized protein M6B38_364325 [Iris pallida]
MGGEISKQTEHAKAVDAEEKALADLLASAGDKFPGSDYHPADRKSWMSGLGIDKLKFHQIVWPGTHDSATDEIGIPLVTRPFAQCQDRSIYDQLVIGARVLDIRVQEERLVCHGILTTYSVDVVIEGLKRFLSETVSELVVLEIRTEFGHGDPKDFDKYLVEKLGDVLIHQDDAVFDKTVAELLPRRVVCVWKPRKSPAPRPGEALWATLRDNWIDTDLPSTKFESNMRYLGQQRPAAERRFLYRVENTATPQAEYAAPLVRPVTNRIRGCARLFVSQAFARGVADRLQVFSTDFIDGDFVDACAGMTLARLEGKA